MFPVDYFLFLQIAFFLCITPGTPRVVIVAYTINYGLKRSVITAIGDISANILQMVFIAFGFGALVLIYPNILVFLKWIGIIYLILFGVGTILSMSIITILLGVPFAMSSNNKKLYNYISISAGTISILFGVALMSDIGLGTSLIPF